MTTNVVRQIMASKTTTYARLLVHIYGVKKERIALVTGATVRTVERWLAKGEIKVFPGYLDRLRRMVERAESKNEVGK